MEDIYTPPDIERSRKTFYQGLIGVALLILVTLGVGYAAYQFNPYIGCIDLARSVNSRLEFCSTVIEDQTSSALDKKNAHFNRGQIKQNSGDFSGAVKDFSFVIQIDPGRYEGHFLRGKLYSFTKELRKARADLNEAIRIRPAEEEIRIARAMVLIDLKEFSSSLKDLDMAIRMDDRNAKTFLVRAFVRYQLGAFKESLSDINKFFSTSNSQNWRAYVLRSAIYRRLRNDVNANQDMKNALDIATDKQSVRTYFEELGVADP
ncbi:MAG: hypothetical protein HN725_16770 [Alphaproteobacteria bacterium]|nr:hypothetical protein [Alphaproteobacteria bacterium]